MKTKDSELAGAVSALPTLPAADLTLCQLITAAVKRLESALIAEDSVAVRMLLRFFGELIACNVVATSVSPFTPPPLDFFSIERKQYFVWINSWYCDNFARYWSLL